jgi:hypothetical protein
MLLVVGAGGGTSQASRDVNGSATQPELASSEELWTCTGGVEVASPGEYSITSRLHLCVFKD